MKRTIAVSLGALSLTAAGLVGFAPTAGAQTAAPAGVQAGAMHLYQNDNYGGGTYSWTSSDSSFANNYWNHESSAGSVNDGASSMKNTTSQVVRLYQTSGGSCSGDRYTADPKSSDKDLSSNSSNPDFDNKASCVKF
ncbi:peptidase inhibitor family I36 protein [Streptomyces albidus (ex Kaewkla and Franco 2022)]|uniref:peptidase inhibitor family I36 protein n=1 Tax=Streptomyces albidus (ex Kaewkla and Franco 2022) TaxID=722709 RepID=UPI0015EEB54E|nr:peptidase inhibitor family I36 protein [Streptomyces albidus (ex Kaewkla and Franco 2022)]